MTAKRELYDTIVKEVREAVPASANEKATYTDMLNDDITMSLDADMSLEANINAFADYTIRDAILVNAVEDEFFAYVLVTKVIKTCLDADEKEALTQDHIEALTTVAHVATMWEQDKPAEMLVNKVIPDYVSRYELEEPSLNGYNRRIMEYKEFPYESCRRDLVRDLKDKAFTALDTEEGAE